VADHHAANQAAQAQLARRLAGWWHSRRRIETVQAMMASDHL
jgi:hypothetical protein